MCLSPDSYKKEPCTATVYNDNNNKYVYLINRTVARILKSIVIVLFFF